MFAVRDAAFAADSRVAAFDSSRDDHSILGAPIVRAGSGKVVDGWSAALVRRFPGLRLPTAGPDFINSALGYAC